MRGFCSTPDMFGSILIAAWNAQWYFQIQRQGDPLLNHVLQPHRSVTHTPRCPLLPPFTYNVSHTQLPSCADPGIMYVLFLQECRMATHQHWLLIFHFSIYVSRIIPFSSRLKVANWVVPLKVVGRVGCIFRCYSTGKIQPCL